MTQQLDVLIVEDNPADFEMVKRYLQRIERWQFSLGHSSSKEEAVKRIEDDPPDLVILDNCLPRLSGLDFLRDFQQTDLYVPIIMLTGEGNESLAAHALRDGADDYLSKSEVTPDQLEQSIEYSLETVEEKARRELKILELKEKGMAEVDQLTGLNNRRALLERLETEMEIAKRDDHPLSLIMLDLDNFKDVNDQRGHIAGDELLQTVSRALGQELTDNDYPARYGGDEFVVIFPERGKAGAIPSMSRILSSIRAVAPVWLEDQKLSLEVTASIGCALYGDDINKPMELIDRADRAMYVSKSRGGDRYTVFEHLDTSERDLLNKK